MTPGNIGTQASLARNGLLGRLQGFFATESAPGVLLFIAAVLAMVVANSSLAADYRGFLDIPIVFSAGSFAIAKPRLLWVNDGLMALLYIFNGYFNDKSDCLAGFTAHKIRQYPVHVGCASLGICTWNPEVADLTTTFMKTIGYKGVLDIGYRWDPRDGKYKVLDINPRVGQAFRLFVDHNDMSVVRALYLDLTGQQIAVGAPLEGRRWIIEDYDLESSLV